MKFCLSGIMRINKDGSHEVTIGPPSFGKMNAVKLMQGGSSE